MTSTESQDQFYWDGEPRIAKSAGLTVKKADDGALVVFDSHSAVEVFEANGTLSDGVYFDQVTIRVADDRDKLVSERFTGNGGQAQKGGASLTTVKAPMPGLVRSLRVKVGEEVMKGATLVVLEAMKMENNILAPKNGRVVKITAIEGSSVEKNVTLCEIEAL